MRLAVVTMVASAALFSTGPAAAQDSLLDYVQSACQADLDKYCSQVTPGEGRLLYCVAAHEDKISGECSYALYKAATLLQELAETVVAVASACEADIAGLCGSVEAGEGRILSCLDANKARASEACRAALADAIAE